METHNREEATTLGRFLGHLERQNKFFMWLVILVAVLGLGVIDYETGPGLSVSLFYVFPVALASWTLGASEGLFVSFVCAIVWEFMELAPDQRYVSLLAMWNIIERLGILTILSLLFAEVHDLLKNESRLSHTDFLTGILNRRAIFEYVPREMERLKRTGRPFTLIYMDLDDFKIVNDTEGHATGDFLLNSVANVLKENLRGIDLVARTGGDEFAAFLPETDDASARIVVARLQRSLMEEMQKNNWPITFSIGMLTCLSAPSTTDELFQLVDGVMYEAKKGGKNSIRYKVYSRE